MMIPSEIEKYLCTQHGLKDCHAQVVSGGSINDAFSFEDSSGEKIFVKYNKKHPSIIECEVEGLEAIANCKVISTPKIIDYSVVGPYEVLQLEFIEEGRAGESPSELLGIQLAELHKFSNTHFGWSRNNFIGSMHQANEFAENYSSFLADKRLRPQVKTAYDKGLLDQKVLHNFETLYRKLPTILPETYPSLVHGDLWSGNYLISKDGVPYLIDPSIHYGSKESDLAFTYLFGGFDPTFYEAYQYTLPLEPGFDDRISLYNLYPLLVHLNLFGRGYHNSVLNALNKYS